MIWFGVLVILLSIQFPNVAVWIAVLLDDGARLLSHQEHNSDHNKHRLRDKQCAAKPLQVAEGLRPTVPERKRRAKRNAKPDDRQETKEPRPRSADGMPCDPTSAFDNLDARFHARRAITPNDQHQRWEPAAKGPGIETELNGWLPSAACCGSTFS